MHVAVTAVGADRPGIVAAVTRVLYQHGANIEDSRMAILGGHFAMVLIVAVPADEEAGVLEVALQAPARELGLIVSARPVAEVSPEHAEGTSLVLSVYGADRPGIVSRVSEALAERRVNISDLSTYVVGEPAVYVMIMDVVAPSGLDLSTFDADLKALAVELGVDVTVQESEPDTL